MTTWVCFEDPRVRAWTEHRNPKLFSNVASTTLDQWLLELGFERPASPQVREEFLKNFLPVSLHSELGLWEEAIEHLRWAGVDSPEHADFLFSQLPRVPKNQLLHFLLSRRLEAGIWDEPARIRAAIEEVRLGLLLPPAPKLLFIRSVSSSASFLELSQAFKALVPEGAFHCLGPYELMGLQLPEAPPRSLSVTGTALERLDALATAVARSKNTSEVFLDAAPKYWTYLQLRLSSLGVSFYDGMRAETSGKAPRTQVAVFPWEADGKFGGIDSAHQLYFFEEPSPQTQTASLLSADEKKSLRRFGFGGADPVSAETAVMRTPFRKRLFVNADFLRTHPGRFRAVAHRAKDPRVTQTTHVPAPLPAALEKLDLPLSLSATSARSYLECPAKFYFQQRLELYPAKNPRDDLQLYFGVLVHKALEFYFASKMDPELEAVSLDTAFARAYEHGLKRETSPWLRQEVLQTLWNRLSGSVEALEAELDLAFGKRTPIALEHGFRLEWEGTTLKGRIDRIDRLENGTLLLIDYKTGSVDFTPAHVGQGKDLQPWFYLRAAENLSSSACSKVGGILYYDLKMREVSRGMLREDSLEKDKKKHFTRGHVLSGEAWDSVLSLAQEKLQTVREGVKAGRFAPTPSPTLCERCDYFLHCRSSSLLGGKAI
jgi:hypothetical protein